LTNRADHIKRKGLPPGTLPSPWCEVFRASRAALGLAVKRLESNAAGRIRKARNVARAGASRTIDLYVERFLIKRLNSLGILVLSEETGLSRTRESDYFAILDPIDGTSMALRGTQFYSVAMACGRLNGGPILQRNVEFAVVSSPSGSFHALRGSGAFFNGEAIHTSQVHSIKDSTLRLPQKTPIRHHYLRRADSFIFLGSTSLEMCLVARGNIDAYIETKRRKVFDYAAATLIVQEAGGVVCDIRGKGLPQTPVKSLTRSTLIAAANHTLLTKIIHARKR